MEKDRNEVLPLDGVREFWGVEACGTQFVETSNDRLEFFAKYREHRDRTLWFVPEMIPFGEWRDKNVLEIGCGNGADGARFAMQGARYTGVDLTQAAVDATKEHFSLLGLQGSFQIENAEKLGFEDESFDLVYSFGVLHHTPRPEVAITEVHRVLKPGGRAIVMLYHKNSFNYFVRILGYMRFRLLLKILSRLGHWGKDRQALREVSMLTLRGNQTGPIWDAHYKNFLERGWSYLAPKNFVHHCTDGPECPLAYVFTRKDAERLFSTCKSVHTAVAHFPLQQYLGNWFPFGLERFLASKFGWALIIDAVK